MDKKDELNLLELIREFHRLHNLISREPNKYDAADYASYLMIANRLNPRDVIGFLLNLIDKADHMERVGSYCKHELVNGIDWHSYNPCCEAANEYRKVKDEKI